MRRCEFIARCPLLALSRHGLLRRKCLLSRVKQTLQSITIYFFALVRR